MKRGKCRFYVFMSACGRETLHPMLFFPSAERPFTGSGNPGLAITIYFWSVLMGWVYLLYNTLVLLAFLIAWWRDIKIIMNMPLRRSECTGAVGRTPGFGSLFNYSFNYLRTAILAYGWVHESDGSGKGIPRESQCKKIDRASFFHPSFAILKISAVVKGPPLVTSKGFMRI